MPALGDAIRSLVDHPTEGHLDRKLARSILGTDDVDAIASRLEAYVRDAFAGQTVRSCSFFIQSVGAVWGIELEDGERIVLKAHALGTGALRAVASLDELTAAYSAQSLMADRGVPCARVLRSPRVWPGGAIAAISFLDVPARDDPHVADVRRAMADLLARTAAIGRAIEGRAELTRLPCSVLPPDALYPAPHNALFDFSAPGGEWIDERARTARAVLDAIQEPAVIMHTDVSGANVKVAGGRVVAVFDMDSVARIGEMRCLGNTATHFTYTGDPPWTWPIRSEASAFVEDYARARGRSLRPDERRVLDAAAISAMAYTARCEHGLDPEQDGPMRALLRQAPDAYLA
jgi:hypothetical protein